MPGSTTSTELVDKVKKYVDMLKRDDKIEKALARLERIEMTLDLLQKTKVGKAVNRLQSHEVYGTDAYRIVSKWKDIAKKNGIIPRSEAPQEEDDDSDRHDRKRRRSESPPHVKVKKEVKEEVKEEPHDEHPETSKPPKKSKSVKSEPVSFAEAMASCSSSSVSAKPRKPKTWEFPKELPAELPELDNYKPLPQIFRQSAAPAPPEEEEFNPETMFKPRNDRGKVFAGRRKEATFTEVPSLYDSCMRAICNNLDFLEDTGSIPYDILKPALSKCNVKQLLYVESRNPYLEEDTDELWKNLFTKRFGGKRLEKGEVYKDAYMRMEQESEDKLARISKQISSSHKVSQDKGQRTAMLSDAKAPRHIRIKQMKNGTGHSNSIVPHALEVSQARKKLFETGTKASLAAIPSAVINRNSQVGAKKDTGKKQVVKKGALMAKTLKMLNIKRR